MELLVKIVNDCKLQTFFAKKGHFRCDTGSDFVSDYNKAIIFAKNKRPVTLFFGMVAFTTYPRFHLESSKSKKETLKT